MQQVNSIEEKVNNLEQKQYVREEIVHPSLESLIFSYNLCDFTSNTESYFNTRMKENHEEKPDNTVKTTPSNLNLLHSKFKQYIVRKSQ